MEREYYPNTKFGKIGVLILPEEKKGLEKLAAKHSIPITILPRLGISLRETSEPENILAFQLMGKEKNGNTCPFLEIESTERSPHGGYKCKIYEDRPLACRAYPIIESCPIAIDSKCKFSESCGTPSGKIDFELESLKKIKDKMKTKASYIWRYATGIGDPEDKDLIENGWFLV